MCFTQVCLVNVCACVHNIVYSMCVCLCVCVHKVVCTMCVFECVYVCGNHFVVKVPSVWKRLVYYSKCVQESLLPHPLWSSPSYLYDDQWLSEGG